MTAPTTSLAVEGGATLTTVLLVEEASGGETTLASFVAGPGNIHLLPGEALDRYFEEIRDRLPRIPDRLGVGLAGVRSAGDRERVAGALTRLWPGRPASVSDDLLPALEATEWAEGCAAQVLLLSGTGSCCLGRRRDGDPVKVGGRGHVIGDRGSACDIALHALRSVVTISDIRDAWPPLGADLLSHLQMTEPEPLIEWSMAASKTELASLAKVVFEAAATRRDEIALAILARAAGRLAKDAAHAAARVAADEERVQFVLNGAVLLKNPAFADEVAACLMCARPGSTVERLERSGAWGVLAMARRSAARPQGAAAAPKGTASAAAPAEAFESQSADAPPWRPVADSPTEGRHPGSSRLSELPLSDAIRLMLEEDAALPPRILAETEAIEWTVERAADAFARGGRLIYCGAGTSGRLGVLDASECPPTFRSPTGLVQGIIAGGPTALWSAVEGAEDDGAAGRAAVASRCVSSADLVVGITASGHAPFVWGCLAEAKRRGAATVLLSCNPSYRDHPLPDRAILPDTGPEILTGSTRLKAGTATKLVLNLVSTLAMVRSGKVIGNLMVDLNPSNSKLRDRATRIVRELTGADEALARETLEASGWVVRLACERLSAPGGQAPDADADLE